ncbi:hypothetical protein JVU11DRAFT_8217 [Chiua virens]|nr:hypothetical protein JVU11DRAFT_8217 [Chiua virens]
MVVFDGVHYSLSQSISPARRNELTAILDLNGATSYPPHTHLITLPASHAHSDATNDPNLKLVTDRWVDRSVVMGKRQPEQYYSPDPAMIFSGVVACATDLVAADLEVLSAGITALGGHWRIGLTRDVTHLFALRPGSDKYNTALHFASQTHMYILTPHWFDDAVRLGRRIPETPYTWPDPPILRPGMTLHLSDEPLATDGRRKRKPAGDTVGDAGDGTEDEIDHVPVWAGRRIFLSPSLEMGGGSRGAIEAGIHRAGGVVVPIAEDADEDAEEKAVDECDVFITRWRSGKAYFKAARASLLIGTLSWLFSVESGGTLYSPLDSLIWYPTPRGGIPGLIDCEISITNYTGEARDYIKRLILLVGAKFTPSMTQSNKVLVAGFQPSPKTARAYSWSIPVVNHTWLEDCFAEWRALTVGLERYIVYPPGIDFGKMLMTRQDGSFASQPVSISRSTGGAVPGGRSVNIIDVEEDEIRDAEYRKRADDPRNVMHPWKTHEADVSDLTGDVTRLESDQPTEARARPRSRAGSVKKTPPPSLRERPESISTPLTASATGAFTDHVIEIPPDDDTDKEANGKQSTRAAGKQRERAFSTGSRTTSRTSRLSTSRVSSPMRDVEVVVSDSKGSSMAGMGKIGRNGQGKDDEMRQTRPSEAGEKVGPHATRLAKPKSRLAKRKADNQSTQNDNDARASQQGLAKASNATRRSVATDSEHSFADAGEASNTSVPPRRTTAVGSITPVQSGMKPRPKSKSVSKARLVDGQSEDEGRIGIADSGIGVGAEVKTPDGVPKSRNDEAMTKAREKKNHSNGRSETDKAAPQGSNTKNMPKPKRRLSVLVPSVPSDYFSSQSMDDATDAEDEDERDIGKEEAVSSAKPAAKQQLVPRMSRAVAAEALSSSNKPNKPSPSLAKVSVTLLSGKTKLPIKPKPKAATSKEESKTRTNKHNDVDDSEISLIVDATPISRGGPRRSAANKATTRLREEIMPDVIHFEKEQKQMKRRRSTGGESIASVGGEGGREKRGKKRRLATEVAEEEEEEAEVEDVVLVSSVNAKPNTINGKGKAKRVTAVASDDETDAHDLPAKKPRGSQEKTGREKAAVRLMTTGLGLTDDVIKRLTKLGVQMTTKPTDCTHLIAKGLIRTEKFLCAMSVSPYILTKEWPNASAKSGKLLPENNYLLSDDAAEKKWSFKLSDAMVYAKGPEGGPNLFQKMTFYLTPNIPVDAKLLKNVVLAGGGQVRITITPTVRILAGKPNRYVVSCEEDKAIWRPLVQEGFKVYSTELLLRAALVQKIEWDRPESLLAG